MKLTGIPHFSVTIRGISYERYQIQIDVDSYILSFLKEEAREEILRNYGNLLNGCQFISFELICIKIQ